MNQRTLTRLVLFLMMIATVSARSDDRSNQPLASHEKVAVRIEAVAYSPSVVTVFNEFRRYLNRHDFPSNHLFVLQLRLKEVWTSPPFSHCVFTAASDFGDTRAKRFIELMTMMNPTDPGCADIMRLEGTKKWLPGSAKGFEDLVEALRMK